MAEQNGGLAQIKWSDVYNLFATVGPSDAIRRVASWVEMFGNGNDAEKNAVQRMRADAGRIDKANRLASMSPDELRLYNEKRAARVAKRQQSLASKRQKHA